MLFLKSTCNSKVFTQSVQDTTPYLTVKVTSHVCNCKITKSQTQKCIQPSHINTHTCIQPHINAHPLHTCTTETRAETGAYLSPVSLLPPWYIHEHSKGHAEQSNRAEHKQMSRTERCKLSKAMSLSAVVVGVEQRQCSIPEHCAMESHRDCLD